MFFYYVYRILIVRPLVIKHTLLIHCVDIGFRVCKLCSLVDKGFEYAGLGGCSPFTMWDLVCEFISLVLVDRGMCDCRSALRNRGLLTITFVLLSAETVATPFGGLQGVFLVRYRVFCRITTLIAALILNNIRQCV